MQPRRLGTAGAPVVLASVAALAVLALLPGVAAPAASGAQDDSGNELDRFMERVLAQRERNAAARLQYVLDEESRMRLTGPGGDVLWGFRGEYTWYERDGFFVRSPTRIDGVTIDEVSRREYEAEWLDREQRRRQRRQEERQSPTRAPQAVGRDGAPLSTLGSSLGRCRTPFRLRLVLPRVRVRAGELLPGRPRDPGRTRGPPHRVLPGAALRSKPDDDDPASREAVAMDKTSLVTLWVDPAQHQIVRYTFDNVGFDFLPGRWLFRLDDLTVSMTMRQPFEGIWLPERIDMRAAVSLATGAFELSGTRAYTNYREATTGGRIRAIGPDLPR